jgi:tetratricopeptide (TPR) repeat protein
VPAPRPAADFTRRPASAPHQSGPDHPDRPAAAWFAAGLLLVLTASFAAFIPALEGEFLDWDDTDNFVDNASYRGLGPDQLSWMFTTFHMGHYQPLTWLTLGLDYVLWAMNPRGYHLTNLVLHAANAALFYILALRLHAIAAAGGSARVGRGNESPGPWLSRHASPAAIAGAALAALLFSVHPLRVESVAWITERRDLLSACFLLLTTHSFLAAAQARGGKRLRWLAAMWLLFLMAVTSKVIVVTLPLVLLVLDWYPLGRIGRRRAPDESLVQAWLGPGARRAMLEKAPLLIMSLIFGLIASIGQRNNAWLYPLEAHPIPGRIAQSLYGMVFYLRQALWPATLIPIYELRLPVNPLAAPFVLSALAAGVAAVATVLLRRRAPSLAVAAIAYVVFLAPVSGLMQNGPQIAADRYSYLPLMGLAIVAGGAAGWLWRAPVIAPATRVATAGGAALVLVLLATLTWRQCAVWRSTDSLWAYAAAAAPDSSVARNGHGYMLLQQGRLDEAAEHLRAAVRLQPSNTTAHQNVWKLLERRNAPPEERIAAFRESLRMIPGFIDAEYNLGRLLLQQQENEVAERHFRAVIERRPGHAPAHVGLAIALMRREDWDGAIRHNEMALHIRPAYALAHYNLAEVLRVRGRPGEAIDHLREAVRLDPQYTQARTRLRELEARPPQSGSPSP